MHHRTKPKLVYLMPCAAEAPIELAKPKLKRYPDTGYELNLDWAKELVPFEYFDSRYIRGVGRLFLDDEGLMKPSPTINRLATRLYLNAGYQAGDHVVGDCILVVEPGCEEHVTKLMTAGHVS